VCVQKDMAVIIQTPLVSQDPVGAMEVCILHVCRSCCVCMHRACCLAATLHKRLKAELGDQQAFIRSFNQAFRCLRSRFQALAHELCESWLSVLHESRSVSTFMRFYCKTSEELKAP